MASNRKNMFQKLKYKKAMKCKKMQSTEKCLKSFSIESYNSIVKLYESRSRLRKVPCTKAKISKYHILETESTGQDIFYKIMSMNVGLQKCDIDIEKNINFTNIIPTVSPILEKFKKQHKMFRYRDKLKYIINKKKSAKQKCKGQIGIHLLKTFFGLVLYKNVPLQLFGTRQNFKAVKKTVYCLLKIHPKKIQISRKIKKIPSFVINRSGTIRTAFGGLLNIEPLLQKLNISKIKWLYPLKNIKQKWIIVLKLLHWFFTQYIIKILHKYIVLISSKQKWLYIMKDDWYTMQHTFINEKISRGDLSLDRSMSENETYNKISVNRLTASSSGLRVISKCNVERGCFKIEVVLRFLQQLYLTYINEKGIPTVQTCIQQINNFQTLSSGNLYYVRCDIQDAFGSIKQKKLLDIIKDCCKKNLPVCIVLREYEKINKGKQQNRQRQDKKTVQFLDMKHLKLRSIGARIAKKPQLVNWLKLISIIKRLLLKNTIKIYDDIYSMKTGVPQGLRLSSIFSEIYYQDMFNKLFSEFKNNGLLCRYVDDILYITSRKNSAEQFVKMIRNDIPEYNVKFNPNKIQTNVELPIYKVTKIRYLGTDIIIPKTAHSALSAGGSTVQRHRFTRLRKQINHCIDRSIVK